MKLINKIARISFVLLLTLFFFLPLFSQEEAKINVGLILDESGSQSSNQVNQFFKQNLDELNDNISYNFIKLDRYGKPSSGEVFQYVLEIKVDNISQAVSTFNTTTYKEVKVPIEKKEDKTKKDEKTKEKKDDSKDKTVKKETQQYTVKKVPVYNSGVKLSNGALFYGRIYDIKSGLYMNGFIVKYNITDTYTDLGLNEEVEKLKKISIKDSKHKRSINAQIKAVEEKYKKKFNHKIEGQKKTYLKNLKEYSFGKVLFNMSYSFHYPPQILEFADKDKKKPKIVQLSGDKYLQDNYVDNVCAAETDEKGYVRYERIAQMIPGRKVYDLNQAKVRFSRKDVQKAMEEGKKMLVGRYNEAYRLQKDSVEKKFTVLPIFNIDNNPGSKKLSFLTYKFNQYLKDIPIFEVLDRGTLRNVKQFQKLLRSDASLDNDEVFELRDQLKGADYLVYVTLKTGYPTVVKLIETASGKLLSETKIDLPYSYDSKLNLYDLVVPAFKINTKIVDINKVKSNAAKIVYVQSMFPLKEDIEYDVFRIEKREVNGEVLNRNVNIGKLKIRDLYSRTFGTAIVKDGGNEILSAFEKGDEIICNRIEKKKKGLSQFISFDLNFDNYENIHYINDSNSHVGGKRLR